MTQKLVAGALSTGAQSTDPGDAWDRYMAGHALGHLMQSRAWAGVRGETQWKPIFLSIRDGETIRAAALCLQLSIPCTGLSLLYSPRGPVLDYGDPALVQEFGAALGRLARERGAFLVQADPAISASQADVHAALERMGFQRREKQGIFRILRPRWVMRIPLDRHASPDAWFASLDRKVRYNMRLPERRGIVVTPRIDHGACATFHRLLWDAGRRKGFPVRSFRYHEAIWRHCVQPGLGEYLFAAHEGRLLAAILVLRFGATSWYMYGASTPDEQQLRSTYLLQWEGIKRAYAAGCRCHDMGGVYSAVPRPEDPEYGLYDFKRQFGAEMVTFLGEYDMVLRPHAYAAWGMLERAVQTPASIAYRAWQHLGGVK